MTTTHTMESLFPEVLTVTRDFELYGSCKYKWFLQRCLRLTKYSYNNDLEAGSEFAAAMEVIRVAYYKGGMTEKQAVAFGVKHLLTNFGKSYAEADYQDDLKTPEKMAEVLERMFHENSMEDSTIAPFEMADNELSVEQDFSIELPFEHPDTGKPLVLKGILDMLGSRDGVIFGVDEKTCKSVLTDADKQADLLRTSNQFVCYVNLANKNKEKFGGNEVTHFRVNKCKIKKNYGKTEQVVEGYEFLIDLWFQKTWWNNMLYQVEDMIKSYKKFCSIQMELDDDYKIMWDDEVLTEVAKEKLKDEVVFPRSYGNSCTLFFRPCIFTYHCTSGSAQDLLADGFQQIVNDNRTKGTTVPLHDWRKHLLNGVPLPEKEVITETTASEVSLDDFLGTF